MVAKSIPIQIFFYGSKISKSGYKVVTNISIETHGSKEWPYLSFSIYNRDGTCLYQSKKFAAWFKTRLCWDEADRLWLATADTGIDVIASTANGWRRYRWMPDLRTKTMIDAESGEILSVVDWEPPLPIKDSRC